MDIFIHFQIFILSITYVTHPILGIGDFCKQLLAPTCFLTDSSTFPPPPPCLCADFLSKRDALGRKEKEKERLVTCIALVLLRAHHLNSFIKNKNERFSPD